MSEIVAEHLPHDRFRGLSKSYLLLLNLLKKGYYAFPFALWIE